MEGLRAVCCHFVTLLCRYKLLSASLSLDIMMKLARIHAPPFMLSTSIRTSIGESWAQNSQSSALLLRGSSSRW